MAANPTLPATGTGTADIVVATEEIAGAQLQRVKLAMGGSNVDSGNIASGAGAVGATVPRVTLASDDPAVAVLGATGDAAITTDTTGSLSGKLRGLVKWAFERMPASLGDRKSVV